MKQNYVYLVASLLGVLSLFGGNAHAQVFSGTDLFFTLTGGGINIGAPLSVNFGTLAVSSVSYDTSVQLTSTGDYFFVDDLNGFDAGYYTTIQSSALSTTGYSIPATNVALKVDPLTIALMAGSANPLVTLGSSISASYLAIDTPIVFIERDTASNLGKTGKYGVGPWLQITIPAYASKGVYTGTLTYTIYEN